MKKMGMILIAVLLMMGCPEKPDFDNGGTKPDGGGGGTKPGQEVVKVEKVEISPAEEQMVTKDDTRTLYVKITPETATNQEVTWSAEPTGVVELTPDASGSCNVKVVSSAAGSVTITAVSKDNASAKSSVTWTVLADDGIDTEITRGPNTFRLVKKVVFNDAYDYDALNASLTCKEDKPVNECTIKLSKSEDGKLKVQFPTTKYEGDLSFPIALKDGNTDVSEDVSYIAIKAAITKPASDKSISLGIGTVAANDGNDAKRGWANEVINGYNNGWNYRIGGGRTSFVLNDSDFHTYGIDFTTAEHSIYYDASKVESYAQATGSVKSEQIIDIGASTYYIYMGQEGGGENTLTIESIAFYKKVGGLDGPFGNTLKFYDAEQTAAAGSVSVWNNDSKVWTTSSTDLQYDLRCGTDAFVLYHEDNFDYPNGEAGFSEMMQAPISSTKTGKAWRNDDTWNATTMYPAVDIKDGKMVLSVYKVLNNDGTGSLPAGYSTINKRKLDEIKRTQSCSVGSVLFGEDWLYGYMEGRLFIDHQSVPGNEFWCGFYTLGTKKIKDINAPYWPSGYQQYGEEYKVSEIHKEYEFDIWEEYDYAGHQILHTWCSEQGKSGVVSNRGNNNRFNTDYEGNIGFPSRTGDYTNPNNYVNVAMVWTPEKVVFYMSGNARRVIIGSDPSKIQGLTNSFTNKGIAGSFGVSRDDFQVIPDIAQTIYLVIAANGVNAGGGVMRNAAVGTAKPFVYYDSFKYYKYVGSLEDKTQN